MLFALCKVIIPYRGKKSRGKVTKFFASDEILPDQYFSKIFFDLTKNSSRFFLSRIIIIISNLFAKFIITIFFFFFVDVLSIFNKNFETRVKARN